MKTSQFIIYVIYILSVGLISLAVQAADLSSCLVAANTSAHRLEKEDALRNCFDSHKASVDKNTCYLLLAQKVSQLASTKLNEEINSICFYETTPAKNINLCLKETKKFKSSVNHDEAVFFCYQQFQDGLSQKDCLRTAEHLVYPLKKEHLQQHCQNNTN